MKTKLILFCLLLISGSSISQTLGKFGVKAGVLFTGMETSNISSIFTDSAAYFNFLGFDFGIYAEWFNSKKFCLSTELHYCTKGERNPNFNQVLVPVTVGGHPYYEYRYLSDRFHYISMQVLPRYRIVITPSDENIYLLGGIKSDLLVSNSISGGGRKVDNIENMKFDFGVTAGFGVEIMNLLSFEFRYEHTFRGPYEIVYGDKTVTRKFNSLIFLTGISFKKK